MSRFSLERPEKKFRISQNSFLYTTPFHETTSDTRRADMMEVKQEVIKNALEIMMRNGFKGGKGSIKECMVEYIPDARNIRIIYRSRKELNYAVDFMKLPRPKFDDDFSVSSVRIFYENNSGLRF